MDNIIDIFNSYIEEFGSLDLAEFEFKKAIHAEPELREKYRQWCHEVGSTEKNGFFDYCEEYVEKQNDVWENLNDFDE